MTISDTQYHAYADAYSERVSAVVESASHLSAFSARLAAANLTADRIVTTGDLAGLPILSKDDVLDLQRASPPFGGMLAPDARVFRIFQSPGPLYEPQLSGVDPWRWAPALRAAGFGESDTVLNCFGYHLSPAGAMFDEGSRAVGASVVPGGIGSGDLQARAICDLPITAYTGLPSYLKALIDKYESLGLERERWTIERAVVTAEPLPDSLRAEINTYVPVVRMAYGTAETGLLGYEDEPGAGLVVPEDVLVQICDLTSGEPIARGEGQIVVTLFRPEYPLIRFGTGDISAWIDGGDGRPRLAGILGRVGQAVKVRGMFLHPAQATRAVSAAPGVSGFRMVVGRVEHRDSLRCEIVIEPNSRPQGIVDDVKSRIKQELRFTCEVETVQALPIDSAAIVDERDWS